MADQITVSGMVLSSAPIGETDRRVVLLTRENGRISAFARGARKPTSRLVGCTRPFSFGKFWLYPGRDSFTLVRAEISEFFEDVVQDMGASALACYFMELAAYFTREGMESTDTLALLFYSMKALENKKLPDALVRRAFELKMLSLEGLLPEPDGKLSKSASYAVNFVRTAPVRKLFTFLLTDPVLEEVASYADRLVEKNVDRPLPAREMLSVLT